MSGALGTARIRMQLILAQKFARRVKAIVYQVPRHLRQRGNLCGALYRFHRQDLIIRQLRPLKTLKN